MEAKVGGASLLPSNLDGKIPSVKDNPSARGVVPCASGKFKYSKSFQDSGTGAGSSRHFRNRHSETSSVLSVEITKVGGASLLPSNFDGIFSRVIGDFQGSKSFQDSGTGAGSSRHFGTTYVFSVKTDFCE